MSDQKRLLQDPSLKGVLDPTEQAFPIPDLDQNNFFFTKSKEHFLGDQLEV